MKHPEHFAGVISLGGPFPTGRTPLAKLIEARRLPIFLAAGRYSTIYPPGQVCDEPPLAPRCWSIDHPAGLSVRARVASADACRRGSLGDGSDPVGRGDRGGSGSAVVAAAEGLGIADWKKPCDCVAGAVGRKKVAIAEPARSLPRHGLTRPDIISRHIVAFGCSTCNAPRPSSAKNGASSQISGPT